MSSPTSDWLTAGGLLLRGILVLVPVQLFLLGGVFLDTFRLVRPRRVLLALLVGVIVAVVTYAINNTIFDLTGLSMVAFAIGVAPFVEEALKGLWLDWCVRTSRTGFMVDAAILGFAVGAGFATVENIYYLRIFPDAPWLVWAIRGLGTAVMHGGASAIFAVLRHVWSVAGRPAWSGWLVALTAAGVFHGGFNRLLSHPLVATAMLLVLLPLVLMGIRRLSERRLRLWLGEGLDRDRELLATIHEGQVGQTALGRYLAGLRVNFQPGVVADMLCLLRLEAELSVRAKGTLMMREHGFEPRMDDELAARLEEHRWLEHAIGRTGLWALGGLRPWQGRDAWQRRLLRQEVAGSPPPDAAPVQRFRGR